jgi:hypothetical protein
VFSAEYVPGGQLRSTRSGKRPLSESGVSPFLPKTTAKMKWHGTGQSGGPNIFTISNFQVPLRVAVDGSVGVLLHDRTARHVPLARASRATRRAWARRDADRGIRWRAEIIGFLAIVEATY